MQKPSMEQPVIFLGWGGYYGTDAIFSVCREYIGNRTIAIIFDDKSLASDNEKVQETVGSGFIVDRVIGESLDDRYGVIFMYPEPSAVKETIRIGTKAQPTKEIGCEYAIAFYCCGEFDMAIVAVDGDNKYEELYTRSFCCK